MAGKQKKGVGFREEPPSVKEIPRRDDVVDYVPIYDPQTGQYIIVPLLEESVRKYGSQQGPEFQKAAQEARSERNLNWRERGYKTEEEARQRNTKKIYNPASGKWEGGKKKRATRKRRSTKKRVTRKRSA